MPEPGRATTLTMDRNRAWCSSQRCGSTAGHRNLSNAAPGTLMPPGQSWQNIMSAGPARRPVVMVSHDAFNRALLTQLDPALTAVGQRTGCWNQLSFIDGAWRVDAYDCAD